MELNKLEFYFKTFKEFLDKHELSLEGKVALVPGCGSGYNAKLIQNI